ncbi:LCP family protein [Ornithinibacillus sp. 4-3]|uniref:LCP family protein n=1 Tax=Ornithinibacillus sp. 4-3 TaxID=3231488 RepID=A0AB39HPG8_9BACI
MAAQKRVRKKRKKWPWVLGIFLAIILAIGAYIYHLYSSIEKSMEQANISYKTEKREKPASITETDSVSFLLLGVDQRTKDPDSGVTGRSDTIIVMTANPKTNEMKMVSIPRDTYTEIEGRGLDKINHAYAFGKIPLATAAVENLMGIPIDYVVSINMEGLIRLVDVVGGITVNNDLEFSSGGYNFNKGTITLDGKAALAYSRMRKEDPQGDFGRQNRQRQVITAITEELISPKTLLNFNELLDVLGNNVQTNVTFDDVKKLQSSYLKAFRNMEQLSFTQGQGQIINKIWYYIMNESELSEIQNVLKTNLEL